AISASMVRQVWLRVTDRGVPMLTLANPAPTGAYESCTSSVRESMTNGPKLCKMWRTRSHGADLLPCRNSIHEEGFWTKPTAPRSTGGVPWGAEGSSFDSCREYLEGQGLPATTQPSPYQPPPQPSVPIRRGLIVFCSLLAPVTTHLPGNWQAPGQTF